MRGREGVVPVQLPARQRDEMRGIEPGVLRVDGDEHLDDVIFGKAVEDHGGHRKRLAVEPFDVGVQGQQPMLTVDGAQDPFALGHLQHANPGVLAGGLEPERFIAGNDHGSRDGRQIPGLPALLVVLNELVDLPADDLTLIGLVVGRNAALEQVPVHLRRRRHALPASPADRLCPFPVAQDFETDQLVDVACAE